MGFVWEIHKSQIFTDSDLKLSPSLCLHHRKMIPSSTRHTFILLSTKLTRFARHARKSISAPSVISSKTLI